eukprot:scaffold2706_cov109-Isochrysis_galbana.AAC.15
MHADVQPRRNALHLQHILEHFELGCGRVVRDEHAEKQAVRLLRKADAVARWFGRGCGVAGGRGARDGDELEQMEQQQGVEGIGSHVGREGRQRLEELEGGQLQRRRPGGREIRVPAHRSSRGRREACAQREQPQHVGFVKLGARLGGTDGQAQSVPSEQLRARGRGAGSASAVRFDHAAPVCPFASATLYPPHHPPWRSPAPLRDAHLHVELARRVEQRGQNLRMHGVGVHIRRHLGRCLLQQLPDRRPQRGRQPLVSDGCRGRHSSAGAERRGGRGCDAVDSLVGGRCGVGGAGGRLLRDGREEKLVHKRADCRFRYLSRPRRREK